MSENRIFMHSKHLHRAIRSQICGALLCALTMFLIAPVEQLSAQGIERESMAGESAAAASHASDTQPYNLRIGPMTIRADAGVSMAYNDNINVAYTGRQSDFIITPNLGLHGNWQATDLNALTVDLGIGYQWYTIHPSNSNLTIAPSSQTQFNIFVGDFKINLHDRFSFTDNPVQVAQLSNVSDFPVFSNTVGFNVTWDLNDMLVSFGYDHGNQWYYNNSFSYLTSQTDTITPTITFNLSKTLSTGFTTSLTSMRYNENVQNNSLSLTAAPFVTAQLSENVSVHAQAGIQMAVYQTGGSNGDVNTNLAGFNGSLGVNHKINDVLNESVTGGQEYIPGITSNYTQRDYVNYNLGWKATDLFSVGTNLWYEHLDDSEAISRETANRFGAGLSLTYNLTDKANVGLSYAYVLKDANPSNLGYSQDLVTFTFDYKF